jgi:hypothetical protein
MPIAPAAQGEKQTISGVSNSAAIGKQHIYYIICNNVAFGFNNILNLLNGVLVAEHNDANLLIFPAIEEIFDNFGFNGRSKKTKNN